MKQIFISDAAKPIHLVLSLIAVMIFSCFILSRIPVIKTDQTVIVSQTMRGNSLVIDVNFVKARNCKFNQEKSLVWYGSDHRRYAVKFLEASKRFPPSRPVGPQYGRQWVIEGLTSLKGTYALVYHTCYGIEKVSKFYVSEEAKSDNK